MALAYEYIERNKRKSLVLLTLFPLSFMLFAYVTVLLGCILWNVLGYFRPNNVLSFASVWNQSFLSAHELCQWVLPICFVLAVFWAWQAWKQGDQIILEAIPHVRELNKWDSLEVYNLLENLCIATGDYLPQLYVLEDESMNAFAIGMSPMRAGIVVSSGLIKRLKRTELEAVLAHELAHIRHYDTRLMVIILTCLAFFTFAGEILFYGVEIKPRPGTVELFPNIPNPRFAPFAYVGIMLMCYGYFVAPVLRFALSRARESMADAQAVLSTRYPKGLISALWRIQQDSRLEALDNHVLLGTMCIAMPRQRGTFFEFISGIGNSHPPIEERIRDLRDMDGGEGLFVSQH